MSLSVSLSNTQAATKSIARIPRPVSKSQILARPFPICANPWPKFHEHGPSGRQDFRRSRCFQIGSVGVCFGTCGCPSCMLRHHRVKKSGGEQLCQRNFQAHPPIGTKGLLMLKSEQFELIVFGGGKGGKT